MTSEGLLSARDAVAAETPASCATSSSRTFGAPILLRLLPPSGGALAFVFICAAQVLRGCGAKVTGDAVT